MSDTSTKTKATDTEKAYPNMPSKWLNGSGLRPLAGVGIASLIVGVGIGAIAMSGNNIGDTVEKTIASKIETSFPKTTFVGFNQTEFGLVEGVTSGNIIYFDQKGDYAFIGEVLEITSGTPITTNRKKTLARFSDLDSVGSAPAAAPSTQPEAQPRQRPQRPSSIEVTDYPEANFVVHNKGAGPVIYMVSDYNCVHCKNLNATFRNMKDVEIREIPVTFMSPDSAIFGAHSLCAKNGAAASNALFDGKRDGINTCTDGETAMEQNTQWAQENGITGTPTLISASGAVFSGKRTPDLIRQFLQS